MSTRASRLSSILNSLTSASLSTPENPGPALLARGIAAARAGDNAVARRLLGLAIRQDPDSGQAWLWLSSVLRTPQGRAYCLHQALARDPGNAAARRGLALLKDVHPALTLTARPPAASLQGRKRIWNQLPFRSRTLPRLGTAQRSPSNASRITKYALVRALALGLTVVVGVFVAILFINFGGFIDEIYRERIEMAVASMSRDMTGLTYEDKIQALAPIKWEMEEAAGLHEPFLSRCLIWLKHGLTLDLADAPYLADPSFERGSAGEIILARLSNTLLLAGAANLLLFILGILAALMLSRRYGSWLDRAIVALSPISSAPNWIYGVMLTFVFAAQLHLLPFGGKYDAMPPATKLGYVLVVLKHMILPVTAVFLSTFFQTAYAWRTYFLLYSREDHVEMAEAQGLPPRTIERRDIMRPALPYVLTSFALLVIGFWQGVLALEVFFNWPGLGALFVQAVWRPDRPTVISLVVIFAYLLAVSVFLLDLMYALVDPRVRIGGGQQTGSRAVSYSQWWRRRAHPRVRLPWQQDALPGQQRTSASLDRSRFSPRRWLRETWVAVRPSLREVRRYRSAQVGLAIIAVLSAISVGTVIAIPYGEAVRLWRLNDDSRYRMPQNAQPGWVNLFRREDLPETIVLSSREGTAHKRTAEVSDDMWRVSMSFVFEYPYASFPQDLAVYLTGQSVAKRPFVDMILLTPDGREIQLESFSMTSAHTYWASADTRLRRRNVIGGQGGQHMAPLFGDPRASGGSVLQGTYELQVDGFLFEPETDLDAELVVYGQVYGLAGTDHQRRDLLVALLWGAPVALAFGLAGAVCTSVATMVIAATGVWFGGWVDSLVQRISEINLMLPALPIAITVYLVYGKSVWAILGVMVLLSIFGSALKNYRAIFLQEKESAYIEAARAYGASNVRIVLRYLVPRILPVLIPQLVILVPGYVFLEATLAFLGVSDVYLPTWGKVINDALTHNVFQGHYYWVLQPVLLLMITGLAFAMVGFALDTVLNPRLRET